ncbi:MAG TPA: hypothetical protein VH353_02170 [Caulobacteraceae bacterium]|nr:hypothetical protein [Caulobacteraceae bacterium]
MQHRGHKAIPAAGDAGYVTDAWIGFGESLAQSADLDTKRGRLNVDPAPRPGEQFFGAHHIALMLEKAQQDVRRPAAEGHGDILTKQQPFDGPKLERTEEEAIAWSMFASRAHATDTPQVGGLGAAPPRRFNKA